MAVMSMPDDELNRIDALIQVAIRLVAATTGGRILLGKLAAVLDPDLLPGAESERLRAALETARATVPEPLPISTVEDVLRQAWAGIRRTSSTISSPNRSPRRPPRRCTGGRSTAARSRSRSCDPES